MKLFGAAAFGAASFMSSAVVADIGFENSQENYVVEVGNDFQLSFAVTFPTDETEDLQVVVRAEADGADKEHKFFLLRQEREPIQYKLEDDVEDIYAAMNGQISASIEDAGLGRVIFNANLTSVVEDFDGTEFTVEADYGQFSDSTSFFLSAYKLPVLETTLLETSINENMSNTTKLIDCAIIEPGYKPKEVEGVEGVNEYVITKIGDLELQNEPDINGTYVAHLTPDDIAQATPISMLNGASASCEFEYSLLGQTFTSNDISDGQLAFVYDPTFVKFDAEGEKTLHEKYSKLWGEAGDEVVLTCEADGNPKPELTIKVDGATVASGAGQDETSKLTTTHKISDNGNQKVTCEIVGANSHNAVADALEFDYHYLTAPVLVDNRVNVTKNVFRAGEDSKNSVFCSADSRPENADIKYTQNGGATFNRDGLFTEAANLTITCIATNLLSGETKQSAGMKIQVLPPLVPDEPESGGANIVVIIIVVLLVILLLGAIAFFIIKKRRESESESSAEGYTEGQPKTSESAGDNV